MQRTLLLAKRSNPYFLFMAEVGPEIRAKATAGGKKHSVTEIAKKIGALYRALPEAQREAYKTKAAALNAKLVKKK